MTLQAGYIDGHSGQLFYVAWEPPVGMKPCGLVVYAHPFAEEHNKSRRMAAVQARALAQAGWTVVMPDFSGCGDSAGDFGEASWEGWLTDLRAAVSCWLDRRPGPLVLWGLRSGCLLLSELCRRDPPPGLATTLLWQPVTSGERYLTQFLRLRMAAGLAGGGQETPAELRARLAAGESLEVAGYLLSPALAEGLAQARLLPPASGAVAWLEVTASGELPPASRSIIEDWRAGGLRLAEAACQGEPFWTTQEIREVPELVARTLELLPA